MWCWHIYKPIMHRRIRLGSKQLESCKHGRNRVGIKHLESCKHGRNRVGSKQLESCKHGRNRVGSNLPSRAPPPCAPLGPDDGAPTPRRKPNLAPLPRGGIWSISPREVSPGGGDGEGSNAAGTSPLSLPSPTSTSRSRCSTSMAADRRRCRRNQEGGGDLS
jgi:hypothetical protein